MSIYSKNGDNGTTIGPNNNRIMKSDQFAEATGSIDELQANLGLIYSQNQMNIMIDDELLLLIIQQLQYIQGDLFSSELEYEGTGNDCKWLCKQMEEEMDTIEDEIGELNHFILPIGDVLSAQLHVARTVCRRTERELVKYFQAVHHFDSSFLAFINRLSDYLFMLARYINAELQIGDENIDFEEESYEEWKK